MAKKIEVKDNEFNTKDLPLICTLIISGNPVIKTYREDNITFFIFNNKNLCEKIKYDFINGHLQVDPLKFSKMHKQIRNFIKDQACK